MREAFTITLTAAAFYGLVRFAQERSWPGLAWILGALLLYLPFSPPFAALLLVMLAASILVGKNALFKWPARESGWAAHRRLWLILGGLALLTLVGIWFSWKQFAPETVGDPVALVRWWTVKSADWQSYLSVRASGKLQAIFGRTPEWTHGPMLIGYGVMQPFLPAALVATSDAPIWNWIVLWRALGWTVLLALLLYATLRVWIYPSDALLRIISLLIWGSALLAAFRGGGDQWDNPRYRAAFAGLQLVLAAWAWIEQQRQRDPLMRRAVASLVLVLFWFVPWYLMRKFSFPWPVSDLFKTIGLGVASSFLFILWDWIRVAKPGTAKRSA
jgi:hypothetical protein